MITPEAWFETDHSGQFHAPEKEEIMLGIINRNSADDLNRFKDFESGAYANNKRPTNFIKTIGGYPSTSEV